MIIGLIFFKINLFILYFSILNLLSYWISPWEYTIYNFDQFYYYLNSSNYIIDSILSSTILAGYLLNKFSLISSISCRTQLNTIYGINRKSCELLVSKHSNFLILRSGPMFGLGRDKDVLHDILTDKQIYVSSETKYSYANISWVAKKIVSLLDINNQIIEMEAKNSISLSDIKSHFKSKSIFKGFNDLQVAINNGDGPDVQEVINFAKRIMINKQIVKWKC